MSTQRLYKSQWQNGGNIVDDDNVGWEKCIAAFSSTAIYIYNIKTTAAQVLGSVCIVCDMNTVVQHEGLVDMGVLPLFLQS